MNHEIAAAGQKTPRRAPDPGRPSDEDLVMEYLPVIRRMASMLMRRLPAHLRVEDLEAAGIVGLLQAAQLRDPERAEQFDAYARRKIDCAMLDELRKHDTLPKDVRQISRRIVAAMAQVEHQSGQIEEEAVARALGVSIEEYRVMLERTVDVRLLSLESMVNHKNGQTSEMEFQATDPTPLDSILAAETCMRVAGAIRRLPDRQRKVLALYYLEELTLKEIGMALDLTQARVCQLHSEAVHAVRSMLAQEDMEARVV